MLELKRAMPFKAYINIVNFTFANFEKMSSV